MYEVVTPVHLVRHPSLKHTDALFQAPVWFTKQSVQPTNRYTAEKAAWLRPITWARFLNQSTPFPADLHHKNAKLYYSTVLAQEGLLIPCILKNKESRVKSRARAFLRKKQFSPRRYLDTLHVLSAFQQTAATLLTALLGHCGERTALGHTAAGSQSFSEPDANRVQLE